VTGSFTINTNKFTVAAASGNTLIAGTLTGSGATGFAIDSSVNQPLTVGTAATTTSVTISRAGQTTTVAGLLSVTGATTHVGTVQVGATGTALNEIRTGSCSNPTTTVPASDTADVTCTIAGNPDLRNFTITLTPQSAPPRFLGYSVGLTTSTAIVVHWINADQNGGHATGAITFNWTAVR
jgi:hypothetical protein